MATENTDRTRRRFLAAGASLGAAVAIAGCNGGGDSDEDEDEDSETETPAGAPTEAGGSASVDADISGEYTLEGGDGEAPSGELAKPLTFQGASGETVTLTMESDLLDTLLVVEGPDGEVVARNDDNDKNFNSRIQTTLEASGEYTVWCASLFESTGDFTFTLRRGEPPFAGEGTRESISYGDSRDLSLEEGDGTDPKYFDLARPFTFEGSSGETVTIDMTANAFDTHLLLTGPDGAVVTENDDSFGSFDVDSRIQTTLDADGEYTIWCGSFAGETTGSFTLSLTEGTSTTDQDSTDSSDTESISYGASRTTTLAEGDGTDPDGDLAKPFTFQGSSGDEVVITMTSEAFDTYLILTDPGGAVVARDDDIEFGSNTNSRIRLTLRANGAYTIWCGSFAGSETGSFDLSLTLE